MKDLSTTKTFLSSLPTTFLVFLMLLGLLDLMSYTMFMNEMSLFQEKLSAVKNYFFHS